MDFTSKIHITPERVYFEVTNKYEADKIREKYDNGDLIKTKIYNPRSIKEHGYFYALLPIAVDAGILEGEFVFHDIIEVNHEMIQAYRAAFKDDEEVLRKIMALAFLPVDYMYDLAGNAVACIASISFAKRDADQFRKFLSDCVSFVASETGIDEKELDLMIRRENKKS